MDPDSVVPTGIGTAPYLDLLSTRLQCADRRKPAARIIELQARYWRDARREFTPIDIERLSWECRKYFSDLNGTQKFDGKICSSQPKEWRGWEMLKRRPTGARVSGKALSGWL